MLLSCVFSPLFYIAVDLVTSSSCVSSSWRILFLIHISRLTSHYTPFHACTVLEARWWCSSYSVFSSIWEFRSPSLLSTSLCLPTRYLMHFFGDNFRCAAHLKRRNKSEAEKKNFTQSRNLLHRLAVIDSRLAVRLRLNFGNSPFTSIVWIKSIMYFYFLFIEKELFIMFHML